MLNRKMFNRKISAGASHAGHHFIGNQQHTVTLANICDGLQVSWWRRDRSQRRAAHGFKDEARRLAVRRLNRALQLRGILLSAVAAAVGAVASRTESAAIAIRNADVLKLAHHRQVDLAPLLVAGNRQRSECRAVIALLAAQDPMPILLADLHLVLARQL